MSSSISSRENEVESVLNKIPTSTYSSKQVSFDTILRFSDETFRKLPRRHICNKDGPLARAAACIDYVLRERYGAEAKLQDLAKAAYMKPKDLKGAMHQIRQWIVNNEQHAEKRQTRTSNNRKVQVPEASSGFETSSVASSLSYNHISMDELVIQCSSCDADVNEVTRSANSLLSFCRSKALDVHKSKYMSSKKDLDRNRMAYMAACFLFISLMPSNAGTGSKSDRIQKVLKVARVAATDFRRVDKFVQAAGKEWKKSYASDNCYSQDDLSQCSSQRSEKQKKRQMESSRRANIMGKASSSHYNDTNFVKQVKAVVAKADARSRKEEEDAGEMLRSTRLNLSRLKRLAELPRFDDWKKKVLDRAEAKYGSIAKAADAIAASHLEKKPKLLCAEVVSVAPK
mmetsp:Transcript_33444/g.48428  ORF Transcript_33444/g.48428 Transcript_33444/m.48428 type:complete len:400 (-) Transcript_33444:496-1695(-)